MTLWYDGTPEGLFAILEEIARGKALPDRIVRNRLPGPTGKRSGYAAAAPEQPELFGTPPERSSDTGTFFPAAPGFGCTGTGGALAAGRVETTTPEEGFFRQFPVAEELYEVSVNACNAFLQAWMSEFPIEAEAVRFAWKAISAARAAGNPEEARQAAEQAAGDRGDPAVETVLKAAYKVRHEIHRLLGFLRFSPNLQGLYVARCGPDHFVLPSLGEHFFRRFGETPWVIIDEKRGLALLRPPAGEPRLLPAEGLNILSPAAPDPWEERWRDYHHAINNEGRRNPQLQRQFIPLRYWKYLSEFAD
ncbi:MAG: TIGR03915 family putative DNA repair protein [Spirochaetaceae bacterium]|jgi:probable DNA metabolism protein|nr:TIGR03915 family putative DNA repair protein [Spirochaetaceae bacterium]